MCLFFQQISPRLKLVADEDDGLTCRICLFPFWYQSELFEHLKYTHDIADPKRFEIEEKEKKIRYQREEQQKIAISKQQRMSAMSMAMR